MTHPSDTLLGRDLAGELQATERLGQELLREIREASISIASFSTELHALHDTVDELSALIRGGAGQESLLARVSVLEASCEELCNKAEKNRLAIEKARDTGQNVAIEETKEVR